MDRIARVLATVVVVWVAPGAEASPPADLASLFPPETLAYAEVVNPADLAPELAAVFKGTALEDSIPFIHGKKDNSKTLMELNGKRNLAILGLISSPEVLAEFKKVRIAAALTGFTDSGDPDFAVVVLTHDSPAAGLAARAFVTITPGLRRVGEVAKVPVFQYRQPNVNYDNNGVPAIKNDTPLTDGPSELTVAYTPGLFVLGSNKTAIGHVIRRFVSEEKGGGLSGVETFKGAVTAHRKTGLFYFVNYPEFDTKFRAANRNRGQERGIGDLLKPLAGGGDLDLLAWFSLTTNSKAVKSVAGSIRFRDGGLVATMALTIDPVQKSPLLDILSGPGVEPELMHHARGPATFAVGVTFPEKNRASAVLAILDAAVKASGELGRLPGEAVREWEQKHRLAVGDNLIGKTRAATVFLPKTQVLPKGAKPMPVFVLHTEDAATAEAWVSFFPIMFGDLSGAAKAPQPSTDTIDGVKVFSVAGAGLPWNAPVHYARKGTAVAVGLDRKLVAVAVTADANASVTGSDKIVSPPAEGVVALGVVSIGDLVLGLLERPKPAGPVVPKQEQQLFLPNGNPLPEKFVEELKKAEKEFVTAIGTLPAATLAARRDGNELRIELYQPKVQAGGLKALIDTGSNWLDKVGSLTGMDRNGRYHTGWER